MASAAVSRKARTLNFSASEIVVLTEKVEENLSIIQSKLTNSVMNQKIIKYGITLRMLSTP